MADLFNRTGIKAIIAAMSVATSTTIIRAGQRFDAPTGPYWTYNIINSRIRDFHKFYYNSNTKVGDTTSLTDTAIVMVRHTLSFTGHDTPENLAVDTQAASILFWLQNQLTGGAICRANGFIPRIASPVAPRYVDLNSVSNEYRIGFDIHFDGTVQSSSDIEKIQTIELAGTLEKLDGARTDNITVTNQ